jgi:hypothetical protein
MKDCFLHGDPYMKNRLSLLTAVAAGALMALPATQALARERGAARADITRDVSRADGDKTTTITGPNGNTVTREVDRAGPGDKTVTTTGPNGETVTRDVERSNGDKTTTITGPNGNSVTREVDRTPRRP